jgi:hypothetical protein
VDSAGGSTSCSSSSGKSRKDPLSIRVVLQALPEPPVGLLIPRDTGVESRKDGAQESKCVLDSRLPHLRAHPSSGCQLDQAIHRVVSPGYKGETLQDSNSFGDLEAGCARKIRKHPVRDAVATKGAEYQKEARGKLVFALDLLK